MPRSSQRRRENKRIGGDRRRFWIVTACSITMTDMSARAAASAGSRVPRRRSSCLTTRVSLFLSSLTVGYRQRPLHGRRFALASCAAGDRAGGGRSASRRHPLLSVSPTSSGNRILPRQRLAETRSRDDTGPSPMLAGRSRREFSHRRQGIRLRRRYNGWDFEPSV